MIPDALVAEVISVKEIKRDDNAPSWFLGEMNWHGTTVPLLSFEAAGGEDISKVNLNTQAVVLYAVGSGEVKEKPYLGLVMSGVPHISQFTREQIVTDVDASDDHPMVAQKVRVNGASVSILDVDAMVEMVADMAA